MAALKKPRELCACGCGREVFKLGYKFFSNKCQADSQYREYIERWKAGLEHGVIGKTAPTSRHIKRSLFEKYGNCCAECGWSKCNLLTGNVPLEIDHINGNAVDNREENLRLICPIAIP